MNIRYALSTRSRNPRGETVLICGYGGEVGSTGPRDLDERAF